MHRRYTTRFLPSMQWLTALKVKYRSEPILPSDLLLLKNAKEILSMVTLKMMLEILVALVVMVAFFIFLEKT
jgi:hypothetical protein